MLCWTAESPGLQLGREWGEPRTEPASGAGRGHLQVPVAHIAILSPACHRRPLELRLPPLLLSMPLWISTTWAGELACGWEGQKEGSRCGQTRVCRRKWLEAAVACLVWADQLQQPHAATGAAQGTQSLWVLAGNTDLPSALTLMQPEDPHPQPHLPGCLVRRPARPTKPARDACPSRFLRLSCVSSSGPHIRALTRPQQTPEGPVLLVPKLMCLLGFKPLFLSFLFSSIARVSRGRCSGEQPRDSFYNQKLLFCHPKITHVRR